MSKSLIFLIFVGVAVFAVVLFTGFNPITAMTEFIQNPIQSVNSLWTQIKDYAAIIGVLATGALALVTNGLRNLNSQKDQAITQTEQQFTATLTEKNGVINGLESQIQTQQTEYTQNVTQLSTQVSTLSLDNTKLHTQLTDITKERDELKSQLDSLQKDVDELREKYITA